MMFAGSGGEYPEPAKDGGEVEPHALADQSVLLEFEQAADTDIDRSSGCRTLLRAQLGTGQHHPDKDCVVPCCRRTAPGGWVARCWSSWVTAPPWRSCWPGRPTCRAGCMRAWRSTTGSSADAPQLTNCLRFCAYPRLQVSAGRSLAGRCGQPRWAHRSARLTRPNGCRPTPQVGTISW